MTEKDTFVTMIGFAKRAGKIVYGYDSLVKARGVKLLAVSDTASDNLRSDMDALADKKGLPVVYADGLEETVGKNVKALGLTDAGMVKAVIGFVTDSAKYKIRYGSRR